MVRSSCSHTCRAGRASRRRRPAQYTVTIRDNLTILESDLQRSFAADGFELVSGARDLADASEGQLKGEAVARVAQQREWLALGMRCGLFITAEITRRRGERQAKRPAGSFGAGQLDIEGLDANVLAGRDAGDAQGEDVGRFACHQGCLTAQFFGLFVVGLGQGTSLQIGTNIHAAEADTDRNHGSVAGQRKAIERLDDLVVLFAAEGEGLE